MKHSKLLLSLAIFYGAFAIFNLAGLPKTVARNDTVYIAEAFLGVAIHLGLAIGLFIQRHWVIPLFVASSALMMVLSWFWLKAHPPVHFHRSTMWLIATIITLFPGCLMFLRRKYLTNSRVDDLAGVF